VLPSPSLSEASFSHQEATRPVPHQSLSRIRGARQPQPPSSIPSRNRPMARFVGHRELKRVEQGSWPDNYPLTMIKGDLKTVEDPSTQDIFIAHHDYRGRLDWRESNDFYAA
jgi:hypothetical protein